MKGKYQILVERIAKATGTKLGFTPLVDFPRFVWSDSPFAEDDISHHPNIEELCEYVVKQSFIRNERNRRRMLDIWICFRQAQIFNELYVDSEDELDLKLSLMGA